METQKGETQKGETQKEQKPKKIKCFHCKKKCGLINFSCECGKTFCGMHRYPHSHNCSSSVKKEKNIKILENNNPKIMCTKISAI